MIQNFPLIPKQAFLLFPEGRDVCFEQKGTEKRLIFGNGNFPEYTKTEKKKIEEFKDYVKKDPIFKQIKQNDEILLLKMIYANKQNFQNALANLKDYKKWESEFVPVSSIDPEYRQKMDALLKTGVFYVSPTRDQYFKPMIIVHVGRLLKVKPEQKLFLDAFGYFLQSAIDQMMINGQVETWNVIVDVDQTSAFSFAGALFDLIKFLSRIFIGRMYRCYIVDYPFLIKFVWGTVSMMMDAEQNEKCRILTKEEMVKLIPKQTLQQKYGGDLPPLKDFWPLNSPERLTIQKSTEQKMRKYWKSSNKLVSEAEYFQRYKSGKIGAKICKQIIEKFEKPKDEKTETKPQFSMQRLSKQQILRLNSKINIQKQPVRLVFLGELRNSQKSSSRSSTDKTQLDNGLQKYQEVKSNHDESNSIVIRKELFSQLSFLKIFT